MGHSNPNITLGRYTHQIDDDARDAANLFDRVLTPGETRVQ
jgi:integrase